jgi:hypothetical protein
VVGIPAGGGGGGGRLQDVCFPHQLQLCDVTHVTAACIKAICLLQQHLEGGGMQKNNSDKPAEFFLHSAGM